MKTNIEIVKESLKFLKEFDNVESIVVTGMSATNLHCIKAKKEDLTNNIHEIFVDLYADIGRIEEKVDQTIQEVNHIMAVLYKPLIVKCTEQSNSNIEFIIESKDKQYYFELHINIKDINIPIGEDVERIGGVYVDSLSNCIAKMPHELATGIYSIEYTECESISEYYLCEITRIVQLADGMSLFNMYRAINKDKFQIISQIVKDRIEECEDIKDYDGMLEYNACKFVSLLEDKPTEDKVWKCIDKATNECGWVNR